jgi:hypothetical protein
MNVDCSGLRQPTSAGNNGHPVKQSDPNAYADVWTMNPDGSRETSIEIQCNVPDVRRVGTTGRAIGASRNRMGVHRIRDCVCGA